MNPSARPEEKLILALDGMDQAEVLSLMSKLPEVIWVKVGLELFVSNGPDIVLRMKELGKKIFLDLKFHDIPNTVSRACFKAAQLEVDLLSVHSCCGSKALEMANKAAIDGAKLIHSKPPTLLAITILTSWDSRNLEKELLIKESLEERVKHLAKIASNAGCGGCVCSPQEVRSLRDVYPEPFELVTPGIRGFGSNIDDQSRVMDARKALKLGSSRLVIGRLITRSNDPRNTFEALCQDIV